MGLLTLCAGLLLPWLGGMVWLAWAKARWNPGSPGNPVKLAGYGFFVGYTVLFIVILASDAWTGTVSWSVTMFILAVFTLPGALLLRRSRLRHSTLHPPVIGEADRGSGRMHPLLTAVVLALVFTHLGIYTYEILTRAVYPWDAWFTWVYRAKIWFLAGGMAEMASPAAWAASDSREIYSLNAFTYPPLASIFPYWSALSLGRWSETLVNLPTLLGAVAIGMGLYGACRESGISRTASLACCYLLYSIPIFGTHVALAGYADLWMAAYVGLGFIAVMRGGTEGEHFSSLLGFAMILTAVFIKHEGVVWLLAGLALQLVVISAYRLYFLALAALGAVALASAYMLGFTHVEIPQIGVIGFDNGQLQLPYIGSFDIEVHDVSGAYFENFFAMGNWNLLWVLVAAALALAARGIAKGQREPIFRIGSGFILIFLAAQWLIFGLSDRGEFASSFTAINRLPLQFVPAVLFAAFSVVHLQLFPSTYPRNPRQVVDDRA